MAAASDALAPAREAIAAGDLARAEALALAAAAPPHEGAALDLVGAARFRAGRPAEALEAFERADRAADPPPRGRALFNRAACLEALGRLEEAEERYLAAAAADPSLTAMALASAGFAALDRGSRERARALGERAKQAGGAGAALADELLGRLGDAEQEATRGAAEAAHREGLAAYDAGRWVEARSHFRRAAELDPSSGSSRIMAGAAAARARDVDEARRFLGEALAMPLAAGEAQVARAHLAAISGPERAQGWSGSLHAGGGHDSDVLEAGEAREGEIVGAQRVASAFATAGLLLRHRRPLAGGRTVEAGYRVEALAYAAPAARDYGVQEHTVWVGVEQPAGARLATGLQLAGQGAFTGAARLRGMQAGGALRGWAVLDAHGGWSTRLDLGAGAKRGLGAEFDFLTGGRLDAALTQGLEAGRFALRASYGVRLERIGTHRLAGAWPVPAGMCPSDEPCTQVYQVPLGYLEQRSGLTGRVRLGARLDLLASGTVAWRSYLHESALRVTEREGDVRTLDARRRRDRRLTLGLSVVLHPVPRLDLTVSAEHAVVDSNVRRGGTLGACQPPDFQCHALDYADASARRTTVGVDTAWRW